MALIELFYKEKAMAEKEHPTEDSIPFKDSVDIDLNEIERKLYKPLTHSSRIATLNEIFDEIYGEHKVGFGAKTFKGIIQDYDSNPKKYDWKYTREKVLIVCKSVKEFLEVAEFKQNNRDFINKAKKEFAVLWTLQNLKSCLKKENTSKILWNSLSLLDFKTIRSLLAENVGDLKSPISYDNIKDGDNEKKEFEEILNEPKVMDDVKKESMKELLEALKRTTIQSLLDNSDPEYAYDKLEEFFEKIRRACTSAGKYLDEDKTRLDLTAFVNNLKRYIKRILGNLKQEDTITHLDEALKNANKELEDLDSYYSDNAEKNKEIAKANTDKIGNAIDALGTV